MPIPRSDLRFFFFSPKIFGLRRKVVDIFRKILTDEKSAPKKQKQQQHQVRSSQGHIEDACKFRGLNRKNGGDIRRGINLGFLT